MTRSTAEGGCSPPRRRDVTVAPAGRLRRIRTSIRHFNSSVITATDSSLTRENNLNMFSEKCKKGGPVGPGSSSQRLLRPYSVCVAKSQVRATKRERGNFRATWPDTTECGERVRSVGGDAAPYARWYRRHGGGHRDPPQGGQRHHQHHRHQARRERNSLALLQDGGRRRCARSDHRHRDDAPRQRRRHLHHPESIPTSDVIRPQGTTQPAGGEDPSVGGHARVVAHRRPHRNLSRTTPANRHNTLAGVERLAAWLNPSQALRRAPLCPIGSVPVATIRSTI